MVRWGQAHDLPPDLLASLKQIQETREALLRVRALSPTCGAEAIYHANCLEGNSLTFEEAQAVIEVHRQTAVDQET